MHPQKIDALFYAHSVDEVKALAPLLEKFRSTVGKKAYIAVSGGNFCPCEDAATALKWPKLVCKERRFKIFDLAVGALSGISNSEVVVLQGVYASMKGLIKIHNPSVVITVADIDPNVKKTLKMATETNGNGTTLVLLPRPSIPKVLWMADLRTTALPSKIPNFSYSIAFRVRPTELVMNLLLAFIDKLICAMQIGTECGFLSTLSPKTGCIPLQGFSNLSVMHTILGMRYLSASTWTAKWMKQLLD